MGSADNGFFIHAIVPRHVETVVSLIRKTPDMYVDFKIDLDEQDLTAWAFPKPTGSSVLRKH